MDDQPRYSRILLKLSGEWLMGSGHYGIDPEAVNFICRQIKRLRDEGVEIAIVIGGGNIFRGLGASQGGMDRVIADNMGMLATVINSLALQDYLEKHDIAARAMSAVRMDVFAERYIRAAAVRHLKAGKVIILAGGTGNPFFTTDSAAALRAAELQADIILKATKVDGVYSADPMKDKSAEFFPEISYLEAITRDLKVMDAAAIALCKDNAIPIRVFNLGVEDNLYRAGMGEHIGSLVH